MDIPAHREVDEDEDVELNEDGEAQEDGVQDEAGQAQSPVQSPFIQMDAENLQAGERESEVPPLCVFVGSDGVRRRTSSSTYSTFK